MPPTGVDDDNRGCISMSAQEAEEFNQELAKATLASGGDTYMFVPLNVPGVMKPSFRGYKCPSLTTSSHGGAPTRPHGTTSGTSRRRESGEPRDRKRPASAAGAESSSAQGALPPPQPGGHRSKRPKVQAQPARASVGGDGLLSSRLKPLVKVLAELMRHPFAKPFSTPVDPVVYPDYYAKVLNPVDLGTIKKQLEAGVYDDVESVQADVERVWENCALYNPVGSDIVGMSATLGDVFRDKLDAIPDEKESLEQEASKAFKQQQKQIQRQMQKQLEEMKTMFEEQKKQMMLQHQQQLYSAMPPAVPPMMRAAGGGRGGRGGRGGSKRKSAGANPYAAGASGTLVPAEQANDDLRAREEMRARDMTFEEKSQLSGGINKLRSDNLVKVVSIIRNNMPSLSDADGEIEVDINALDKETLWDLHFYVQACLSKNKAKTKKPAAQTTASRTLAAQQAQAVSEQRIAQLQQSLAASSGGGALAGQDDFAHDDSASYSDSDGDLTSGAAGAAGGGYYDGFAQSKAQSDRERQEGERKRQAGERNAAERRRQKEEQERARIQAERAAARAANEGGGGGIDMLGQSNAMASFEGGTDTFDFPMDEYGES